MAWTASCLPGNSEWYFVVFIFWCQAFFFWNLQNAHASATLSSRSCHLESAQNYHFFQGCMENPEMCPRVSPHRMFCDVLWQTWAKISAEADLNIHCCFTSGAENKRLLTKTDSVSISSIFFCHLLLEETLDSAALGRCIHLWLP